MACLPVTLSAQQIIPDGRTNTQLQAVNPTTTTITTTTITGGNALNSFQKFNVDAGNTVNLIQPSGTGALINIVTGNQISNISGTLNAFKDGRLGGNTIIANTNGIVIGKGGVVNAGRLTLTTPSRSFTDSIFQPGGGFNNAALSSLTKGSEALNPSADISIHGRIDAEAVAIRAGRDLKIDGVIHSRFGNMEYAVDKPSSTGKKVARAQAATGLSVSSSGVVRLFAGRNAKISGKVKAQRSRNSAARASKNTAGGNVYLYAAQDLSLEQQALIDVSGRGDEDAGTAILFGENDAFLNSGVNIIADADAGNAGFIEFSAGKTVSYAGSLSANSVSGNDGAILIDPEHLTIASDVVQNGESILYIADKSITVNDGVKLLTSGGHLTLAVGKGFQLESTPFDAATGFGKTTLKRDPSGKIIRTEDGESITIGDALLSTRNLASGVTDHAGGVSDGASGNILIYAPKITVNAGAELYAQASSALGAGKISLTALREQLRGYNTTDTARAFVHINSATLKAGEIDVSAEVYATNMSKRREGNTRFYPLPQGFPPSIPPVPPVPNVPNPPDFPDIPNLSFGDFGDQFKLDARSEVVIKDSTLTTFNAAGDSENISIKSTAETDISITPDFILFGSNGGPNLTFQELAGLSMGVSETHSQVDIKNSTLSAHKNVSIASNAKETQELTTKIRQNDGVDSIALNLSLRNLTNQVVLRPDTRVTAAGDIAVNALTTKDIKFSSWADVNPHPQNKSLTALASNLSIGKNLTEVAIAADLDADGDVNISAKTIYENYGGAALARIIDVGTGENNRRTNDTNVLAAQEGVRIYVGNVAERLFDVKLNEDQLTTKAALGVIRKVIQDYSFAGALDISEEQDNTHVRIGNQYTDLSQAHRPLLTYAGLSNLTEISGRNINAKSLLSFGALNGDDSPKNALITGRAIRKRAEANFKINSSQDTARLIDGTISTFAGETQVDIVGNAKLQATAAIDINSRVQYANFDFGGVVADLKEFVESQLPKPSPDGDGIFVTTPTGTADRISDYFTTFVRANGNTGGAGFTLNGTYFSTDNKVGTTIRSGAQLIATNKIDLSAEHNQQSLHVANYPLSVGNFEGGYGGSVNFNRLLTSVTSKVENGASLVANSISVKAHNTGSTYSHTYSHNQSKKNAINGALARTIIDNETLVEVGETARITAPGALQLEAKDDLGIWTIGGALGRAQRVGTGLAAVKNQINRSTIVAIGNRNTASTLADIPGAVYISAGRLDIDAVNAGDVVAGAAGGSKSTGDGASVAGSVAENEFGTKNPDGTHESVEALVAIRARGKLDIGSGGIDIDATTSMDIDTLAGALGVNGTNTFAGAVARFESHNFDTRVGIDGAFLVSEGAIAIDSAHLVDPSRQIGLTQVAAGGALKSVRFNGAGSLIISKVNGKVGADVTNSQLSAGISPQHSISIKAEDGSKTDGAAGVISLNKASGFGVSIVHNSVAIETSASVKNSTINSVGALAVAAKNSGYISAVAAASSVSAGTTAPASASINNVENKISAKIENGAVRSDGGVTIAANKETNIRALAGAISGSKATAVGASAAINAIADTVEAKLVTSNLRTNGVLLIDAVNKSKIRTFATSGAFGLKAATASIAYSRIGKPVEPLLLGAREDQRGTKFDNKLELDEAKQRVTNAVDSAQAEANRVNFSVNALLADPSDLTIAGLQLNRSATGAGSIQAGTLKVSARDESEIESLSGGVSGASQAGGGIAYAWNNYGAITSSYLRSQGSNNIGLSTPNALLTVEALGQAKIDTKAASLLGSGKASIGASATLNLLDGSAMADISGVAGGSADEIRLSGGSVKLNATQSGQIDSLAGSASAGAKAGIAGAVAINWMSNDATAKIEAIVLDADLDEATDLNKHIDIDASITSDIDAVAGSAGVAATGTVAGSVAINTIEAEALAHVNGATLDADGNVTVDATNTTTLDADAGAASLAGQVALGASVVVNDVQGKVQALLDNSSISANAVSFDALLDADMNTRAGAGAVGGLAAFNAAFAQNNLQTQVNAIANGSTIWAEGNVNFDAVNMGDNNATLVAVSLSKAVAGGASVALADNNAKLKAQMNSSLVSKAISVTIRAKDTTSLKADGLAVSASKFLAASGLVMRANTNAEINASISGTSNFTASQDILVEAVANTSLTTRQIAAAGAIVGAGATEAKTHNNATIDARIAGTGLIKGRNLTATASDTTTIDVQAAALSAGIGSGAGVLLDAKHVADIDSVIDAARSFDLTGSANISARAKSTITARQISVAAGLIGAGLAKVSAVNEADTNAEVNSTNFKAHNVAISATDEMTADVQGFALAGGVAPGLGLVATDMLARNKTIVAASVGQNSYIRANGTLSVTATSTGTTTSKTAGTALGAVALGISRSLADTNTRVTTAIGNNSTLVAAGNVTIGSSLTSTNVAEAISVAGGLGGVGGADADARSHFDVNTNIGRTSITSNVGSLTIRATAHSTTNAMAIGVAAGLVASGTVNAFAGQHIDTGDVQYQGKDPRAGSLNPTVSQANIAAGARLIAASNLILEGKTTKVQEADVISGAGAAGSQRSGLAETRADSKSGVLFVDATNPPTLLSATAGGLYISSLQQVSHRARVNNVNASLVGWAGGRAISSTFGNSSVRFGNNSQATARLIDVKATNNVRQASFGDNVISRSGGAFDGASADARTNIVNTTKITVGDGAVLRQLGTRASPGAFRLGIENDIYGRLQVNLDSGGAIAIARSSASFNASQHNSIEIGNATLFSQGVLSLYNRSDADIDVKARSTTYGASGSAQSTSYSAFTTTDNILLKSGSNLEGVNGVNLSVGNSRNGDARIRVAADTRLFNRTLIPVSTTPSSDAVAIANRLIDIQAGAKVASANDIQIYANSSRNSVSEYGLGKDLWKEIFNTIFAGVLDLFFDVDVSIDVRAPSNPVDSRTSVVNVAGELQAGNRAEQYLQIAKSGQVLKQEFITYDLRTGVSLKTEIQNRIDAIDQDLVRLRNINATGLFTGQIAALSEEKSLRQRQKAAVADNSGSYLDLHPIYVDEGNITINAATINGLASGKLQARGKTVVDIEVGANYFINTSDILFEQEEGGRVEVNNVAVNSSAEFNALSGTSAVAGFAVNVPSQADNQISTLKINNSYAEIVADPDTQYGPDIVLNGVINNARGPIEIRTELGTIDSRADITALTFKAESPNGGFIQTYKPGITPAGYKPETRYIIESSGQSLIDYTNDRRASAGLPFGYDASTGNFSLYKFATDGGPTLEGQPLRDSDGNLVLDNVRQVNRNYSEFNLPNLVNVGQPTRITALKEVFIAGEFIDVNGLIESGGGVFDLNISNQVTQARLDAYFRGTSAANQGQEVIFNTNPAATNIAGVSGNVILAYDHDTGQLVANSTVTRGGRITLVGDIISTGNGRLRAFDGFGQIQVNNASNFDLVLNAISTGSGLNGVEGVINIVDTGKPAVNVSSQLKQGESLKTTYRYQNGRIEFSDNDNRNDTIDVVNARQTTYQPTLNRRYVYDESRNITITNKIVYLEDTASTDKLVSNTAHYNVDTPFSQNGKVRIELSSAGPIPDYSAFSNGLVLGIRDTSSGGPNPVTTKGIVITKNVPPPVRIPIDLGRTQVEYTRTATKQQIVQHSFKADNPIAVEFVGQTSPGVTINSTGTGRVIFNGSVVNGGPTSVNANADILSASDQVKISSANASFATAGSVSGQGNSALNLALYDNAHLSLSAGKNINIRQLSGALNADGDLRIKKVHYTGDLNRAASAEAGNVSIQAVGNIRGIDAEPVHVRGVNVTLNSDDGGISAGAGPLRIATGQGTDARFNAAATGDISLVQASGDLKVDLVESRTGNVNIQLLSGRVIDANIREAADAQAIDALKVIWKDLGLLADGSNDNVRARLVEQRNAQYAQYWDKRNDQPVDGPINFSLTARERAEFYTTDERQALKNEGLNDAQIDSQIDKYVSDTQALYVEWNNQAAYDSTYSYVVSDQELKDSRAEWQLTQLQYGVPNTLKTDTTDTTLAVEAPNIKAQGNVTILQSNGVGTFTSDLKIKAAEADLFNGPDAEEIYLTLLTAEEGDVRRDGDFLFIKRADDVDVSSKGVIEVRATQAGGFNGNVFLGSEEGVNLKRVKADGEVRVTVSGDIQDVAPDTNGTVNAVGQIVLESSKGNIGSLTRFLRVNTPDKVSARAGENIYIAANDNLNVGRINADKMVSLRSETGFILDAFNDADVNVRGTGFDIFAQKSTGTTTNPLEIQQDAGNGVLRLKAENAFLFSENDLKVERLDVGNGVAELEFKAGNLTIAPNNGEPGLTADSATIKLPGNLSDDENDTLAIVARILKVTAGNIGEVNAAGAENRLNINVSSGELMAANADAVFRLQEVDDVTLGTAGLPIAKEIHVGTGNDLTITQLEARDLINLTRIGGNITSGSVKSDKVIIETLGKVGSVSPLNITTNSLSISANVLDIDLIDPDPSTPLAVVFKGIGTNLATRVDARITTSGRVNINELRVVSADISTTGPQLTLQNATIGQDAWFRQQRTDMRVSNKEQFAGLSPLSDIEGLTTAHGSVRFNLRNENELSYWPDILHHSQPLLTLDSVGDFSVTAHEIISTRGARGNPGSELVEVSIIDQDGAVIGGLVLRFPTGPVNQIDPSIFIQSDPFKAFIQANFGRGLSVQIVSDDDEFEQALVIQ